jgi:hypothetical protein
LRKRHRVPRRQKKPRNARRREPRGTTKFEIGVDTVRIARGHAALDGGWIDEPSVRRAALPLIPHAPTNRTAFFTAGRGTAIALRA